MDGRATKSSAMEMVSLVMLTVCVILVPGNVNAAKINVGAVCPDDEVLFHYDQGQDYAAAAPKAYFAQLEQDFVTAINSIYQVDDGKFKVHGTRYYGDKVVHIYKLWSKTAKLENNIKTGKCDVTVRVVGENGADYIDCMPGDLNVILAAPHGGYEEPESVMERTAGCYVDGQCVWNHDCGEPDTEECDATTSRDSYTQELTRLIAQELTALTGKTPTIAVNLLARRKLDANREINEATFGELVAVEAWEAFHRCINASKQMIEADDTVQGGLFLDIHGHGHPNNWAELGYMLRGSELDASSFTADDTSIVHLSSLVAHDLNTLLRGAESFGHFLEEEGYEAVPSPTNPGPNGERFYSGGYNTRLHGSNSGGRIDSIQIESSYTNRDDPERESYAQALASAIVRYIQPYDTQL